LINNRPDELNVVTHTHAVNKQKLLVGFEYTVLNIIA